jgi:pimeloyl-ACP methyl ester carboxylesterase
LLWALNAFEPRRLLGRYPGPMLVLVGPATDQPWMLHGMGQLPYRIVAGTGHRIQLDKPDEFNDILDEFLAGIGGG